MASGSPPKSTFDFASDDIPCSYEDSNGTHAHSDPNRDFHKNTLPRSSAYPTTNVYVQSEESFSQEVILAVERTLKKSNDNLMRFLEGISSRLSQLELYCYNLDKSIGEMRSEMQHDHGEADAKLKSVDKHLQEVHRSVQILRDKQELAETQKELAKLQLAQKESPRSQEEKVATPLSTNQNSEDLPEMHNLQLALALPNQFAPQRAPGQQQSFNAAPPSQNPPQPMTQQATYYLHTAQLPNQAAHPQPPQGSYVSAESHYRGPQMVQHSSQAAHPQPPQVQQFHQYQQPWSQQVPQPSVQPPQPQMVQHLSQAQIRVSPSPIYATYMPSQPANPPQEALTSPMPMQVPLPGFPYQTVTRAEAVSYGSGGQHQTQPPPQHIKSGSGYSTPGTHAAIPSGGSYMIYDSEGSRPHQPPPTHISQGGYHPANAQLQNPHPQHPPTSAGLILRGPNPPPQFVCNRNHPYNEIIEKLTSMGYRIDLVVSIIQRLEESGQPVDFSAVLDRVNAHSSGGSQRSW